MQGGTRRKDEHGSFKIHYTLAVTHANVETRCPTYCFIYDIYKLTAAPFESIWHHCCSVASSLDWSLHQLMAEKCTSLNMSKLDESTLLKVCV